MSLFGDDAIQKWMRQAPPSFLEWLEQEFTGNVNQLRAAGDLLNVGRFQGILNVLDVLKELRKES